MHHKKILHWFSMIGGRQGGPKTNEPIHSLAIYSFDWIIYFHKKKILLSHIGGIVTDLFSYW